MHDDISVISHESEETDIKNHRPLKCLFVGINNNSSKMEYSIMGAHDKYLNRMGR